MRRDKTQAGRQPKKEGEQVWLRKFPLPVCSSRNGNGDKPEGGSCMRTSRPHSDRRHAWLAVHCAEADHLSQKGGNVLAILGIAGTSCLP